MRISLRDGSECDHEHISGAGLTLVFVHGWCCDRSVWSYQLNCFRGKHSLLLLDLVGFGNSLRKREVLSMQNYAMDIEELLDAQNIESALLVGHSMAGSILVEAAARMGDRIKGIIGIDTLWDLGAIPTKDEVGVFIGGLRRDFASAAGRMLDRLFVPDSIDEDRLRAMMLSADPQNAADAMADCMLHNERAAELMKVISCPRLLINTPSWRQTNIAVAKSYGFDVQIVENVGHFVMVDASERVNSEILHFVETL